VTNLDGTGAAILINDGDTPTVLRAAHSSVLS
jgi:hypothetical protein